jgi:hypothetical protein
LDKEETWVLGPPENFKVYIEQISQLIVRVWLTEMAETGVPGLPAKFKVNRAELMAGFGWKR